MADRDDGDSPRRGRRRPQGDGPLFDLPLSPEAEDRPRDREPRPAAGEPAEPEAPAGREAEAREGAAAGETDRPGDGLPLFAPQPGRGERGHRGKREGRQEGPGAGGAAGAVPAPGAMPDGEPGGGPTADAAEPDEAPAAEPLRPLPAPVGHRVAAALLDGGLLLVAAAGAVVGAHLLGVRWSGDDLAPLAFFLLVFSFAYSVIPLAFWGRTPGMVLTGILARGADGGPLTFGQTALRWIGGLVTLGLAGLPLLLALAPLGQRSLADRLSGSRTWLPPG